MERSAETERLEKIAVQSLYAHGVNSASVQASFKVLSRYIRQGATLELGPAEGVMTDLLTTICKPLTVVEGSDTFCRAIKARHPQVSVVNALFEDFAPAGGFANIILGHVLEHVENPVAILKRAAAWLEPGGHILAAVPNSRSLHRQAAVLMGLLPFEEALNDADVHHGHRRVYNPESFRRDFMQAGLSVEVFGGYWLKPLSNRQIEEHWTPQMLNAFMALGERYPEIAGEIYIIAQKQPSAPYFETDWKAGSARRLPAAS